jgi:hypothetical protein
VGTPASTTAILSSVGLVSIHLGGIKMYLDIKFLEETRITVKLARDNEGNHFVIIRNARETDIYPAGNDYNQAWAEYQKTIAHFSYKNQIF